MDILCIAAIQKRKKIAVRSQQIANNFRSKMTGARTGGTHGSILTPPASEPVTRRPRIARATARGLIPAQ
ncbi:hypothetical protein ACFWNG_18345 [Streptomyces sp. NPDC058391]|uniref:hypothetical protein n=1 Tax=Streptomyces sp. NPDC058391 TaxID=3346476 RepID=UPI00366550D6